MSKKNYQYQKNKLKLTADDIGKKTQKLKSKKQDWTICYWNTSTRVWQKEHKTVIKNATIFEAMEQCSNSHIGIYCGFDKYGIQRFTEKGLTKQSKYAEPSDKEDDFICD